MLHFMLGYIRYDYKINSTKQIGKTEYFKPIHLNQ